MALTKYKSQRARMGADVRPQTDSLAAEISGANTLASRLAQFSQTTGQIAGQIRADEGANQAIKDMEQGKDQHRESTFSVYGRAYNNAADSTYASVSDIRIDEKSKELQEKYKLDPAGYSKEMSSYVDELSFNAPTDSLRSTIKISGTKTRNNTFSVLARQRDSRVRNEQREIFLQDNGLKISQIINTSLNDKKTAELLITGQKEKLSSMVNDGIFTEAEALRISKQGSFDISKGVLSNELKELLNKDSLNEAIDMVKGFKSRIPADETVDEHKAISNELSRLLNNEVKGRKTVQIASQKQSKMVVDGAIGILKKGMMPNNLDLVKDNLENVTPQMQHDFKVQYQAYDITQKFSMLPLPVQMQEFNKLKATPEFNEVSAEVVGKVEQNIKERIAKAKSDPISLSIQERINEPTKALNVSNGVVALSQILPERAVMSERNMLEYGENSNQLFTQAEANEYTAFLESPTTSIVDKLEFITAVEQAVPNKSNSVYAQLRKSGGLIFSTAGGLIKDGKPEVAEKLLRGQMIRQELGSLQDSKTLNSEVKGYLGNAMFYTGKGDQKSIEMSAEALYAYNAQEQGKYQDGYSGDIDDTMKQLVGGIGSRNEQNYFLPSGMDEDDVDDYIDDLKVSDSRMHHILGLNPEEALSIIQNSRMVSYGTNKYAFISNGTVVKTDDNKPFIMEIK